MTEKRIFSTIEKGSGCETKGKSCKKRWAPICAAIGAAAALLLAGAQDRTLHTATTFAMDTVVDQRIYGPSGEQAADEVHRLLQEMENRLSLYRPESDLARLSGAAGSGAFVSLHPQTYAILSQAKALSERTQGAFQLTIAPLALAWGVTTEAPRVPAQEEIDALLPLVSDKDLILSDDGAAARLARAGQAIDLGGVAKGAACDAVRAVYDAHQVRSALCWIGGSSIYARGTKPDGSMWRLGFRDPEAGEEAASLASFAIQDAVFCTSGGYERYFEQDGVRYQHILDPQTGRPVQTDILSVGVLSESGLEADLWSTALFVQGTERALAFFAAGGEGILLDREHNLYVSPALQASFQLDAAYPEAYHVIFL